MFKPLLAALLVTALVSAQTTAPLATPPPNSMDRILRKTAANKFCRTFKSSYDSLSEFQYVTQNSAGSVNMLQSDIVKSGPYAHKLMITSAEDTPHSQYAAFQPFSTTDGSFISPAYIEAFVYFDTVIPKDSNGTTSWYTIARIGADSESSPGNKYVSVVVDPKGYLTLYNVPSMDQAFTIFQQTAVPFPLKQWVNITIYIDFNSELGITALWQNGVLISLANVKLGSAQAPLPQLHFGMFAQNTIPSGSIYNDDLLVREIVSGKSACPSGLVGIPAGNAGRAFAGVGITLFCVLFALLL
jgi:hypothetical protein